MEQFLPMLTWIESQQKYMVSLVEQWAQINSGSDNLNGLAQMLAELKKSFSSLGGSVEEVRLHPRSVIDAQGYPKHASHGNALHLLKHEGAPIRVLLGGHFDTVFPPDSPFQKTMHINDKTLNGPGVADMKGGLVILLKALQCLESSELAGKIGWEVILSPDEEIGSVGSESLWRSCAQRCHVGLIFEPAFFDGSLVSSRKGSSNYFLVARGRAAHAGRDFFLGRNAIEAMSRFICHANGLNDQEKGITINVGQIAGGKAVNIVPDLCICKFNVRIVDPKDEFLVMDSLQNAIIEINKEEGLSLSLYPHNTHAPKPFDETTRQLFEQIAQCGKELGLDLQCKPSGGACDGNLLASEGLPTIDSLGVVGGKLHTFDEYIAIDSLVERTKLTALFLMKLAAGKIAIPQRSV
jgi:glutamate carboxypeptidase